VAQVEPDESDSKVEKWEQTAIEAIKQCGSAWLPKNRCPGALQRLCRSQRTLRLSLLATLQPDAMHPSVHLRSFAAEKQRKPKLVAVWIGPEGDFTPAENERHPQSRCAADNFGPIGSSAVKLPRLLPFNLRNYRIAGAAGLKTPFLAWATHRTSLSHYHLGRIPRGGVVLLSMVCPPRFEN